MSSNHERIDYDDNPRPSQLQRLAAIGLTSAASRQRLVHRYASHAHYFFDTIDTVDQAAEGNELLTEVDHRLSTRVGTKLGNDGQKLWSLKYFDGYWTQRESGQWGVGKIIYRFEWGRLRTHLAERTFQLIGLAPREDTELERLTTPADIWRAEMEVSHVTQHDCEQLIETMSQYYQTINDLAQS